MAVSQQAQAHSVRSFAQSDLELAKWVAVVTMAIDHYGKIVDFGMFEETHAIGRVSFPLFAAIVGIRLATRPDLDTRYLRYLVPWAIVSQPVYVMVGHDWYELNILATLALGVFVAWLWRRHASLPEWAVAMALAAVAAVSVVADYGPVGIAMVPATAYLFARNANAGTATVGPLGVAANLDLRLPPVHLNDLFALLASPIIWFSIWAKIPLPRLPAQPFYAFYPAHLLALHYYDLYFYW